MILREVDLKFLLNGQPRLIVWAFLDAVRHVVPRRSYTVPSVYGGLGCYRPDFHARPVLRVMGVNPSLLCAFVVPLHSTKYILSKAFFFSRGHLLYLGGVTPPKARGRGGTAPGGGHVLSRPRRVMGYGGGCRDQLRDVARRT